MIFFKDSEILKTSQQEELIKVIDFTPPFLKIDRYITFNVKADSKILSKGLGGGLMTIEDIEGHNDADMFLAFCGKLLGQGMCIHVGMIYPEDCAKEIKVVNLHPSAIRDFLWNVDERECPFFVETTMDYQGKDHIIMRGKICSEYLNLAYIDNFKIEIRDRH